MKLVDKIIYLLMEKILPDISAGDLAERTRRTEGQVETTEKCLIKNGEKYNK